MIWCLVMFWFCVAWLTWLSFTKANRRADSNYANPENPLPVQPQRLSRGLADMWESAIRDAATDVEPYPVSILDKNPRPKRQQTPRQGSKRVHGTPVDNDKAAHPRGQRKTRRVYE